MTLKRVATAAGVVRGQPGPNLIVFITDKYSESVRWVVSKRRRSSHAQDGGCKLERREKKALLAAHCLDKVT